jgi:hypothetical protein
VAFGPIVTFLTTNYLTLIVGEPGTYDETIIPPDINFPDRLGLINIFRTINRLTLISKFFRLAVLAVDLNIVTNGRVRHLNLVDFILIKVVEC